LLPRHPDAISPKMSCPAAKAASLTQLHAVENAKHRRQAAADRPAKNAALLAE